MPLVDHLVNNALNPNCNFSLRHDISEWQTWPGELSDSMSWSAQFIDPSQNLHFNAVPMPDIEISIYTPLAEDA
jgi:hypothetical protein